MKKSSDIVEIDVLKVDKLYSKRYRFKEDKILYKQKKDVNLFNSFYYPLLIIFANFLGIVYAYLDFPIINIIIALVISSSNLLVIVMLIVLKNNISKLPMKYPFIKSDVMIPNDRDIFLYKITNIYFKSIILFLSFCSIVIGITNVLLVSNIKIFSYIGDENFTNILSSVFYLLFQILIILGLKTSHKVLYNALKQQKYYICGLYNDKNILFID